MSYTSLCVLSLMLVISSNASAFHADVYQPRAPQSLLAKLRQIKNPYPATSEHIEKGRGIYFGKGLCVTCHGNNGKGAKFPGHSPRDFTDKKWQSLRSDGEIMWVLENGSPGTGMSVRVGHAITLDEAWSVIHFIRTFGKM